MPNMVLHRVKRQLVESRRVHRWGDLSPRDIAVSQLREHIARVRDLNSEADRFFDPQYYAAFNVTDPEARLGRLTTCEEYEAYFRRRRRRELERDTTNIATDIRDCLTFQNELDVTGLISPNILISRSFDSIEGAIAKNFIRLAGEMCAGLNSDRPLYATLAVSREALMDRASFFVP